MRRKFFLFLIAVIPFITGLQAQQGKKLTSYVNPFIGTGAVDTNSLSGSNFPGATTPFGFVQLSPDTRDDPQGDPASGYDYNDRTVVGFTHTHLSGTGVGDLFDILVMPGTGKINIFPGTANVPGSGYRSKFSHDQESARPGYYQVKLLDYGINAELTATEHAGFHQYTFPESSQSHILFDLYHSRAKEENGRGCKIIGASIHVVNNTTIEGYRILTGWARLRKVYFFAEFSRPFTSHVLANGGRVYENLPLINGSAVRGVFSFYTKADERVLVKVGLSSVSMANAKSNLQKEIAGWNFDQTVKEAEQKWEKELSKISIKGTEEQKIIFYTAIYHALIQPNNTADINGDYQATDLTIRNAPDKTQYSTFSLWDTYRAAHPLYTLIEPERTGGFINSMIRQQESYGYLPIWQLWNDENYCMIGNHAIPVIVDAVFKGIKGFDINKAYEAVKASSLVDHPNSPFGVWEKYGYMPENLQTQSVSITLENAYDDWCVAQFARKMGKTEDYQRFMKRSEFYKNLFDGTTGFFRAKNSDGNWLTPFNPMNYGGNGGNPYTEANAWQYLWYVPQNVQGLITLMGGNEAFTGKLDQFFSLNDSSVEKNGNASGFIGQYAHGNEPSHHITYLYDYAGQPWKTQYYVAKVRNEQYTNNSSGYTGNDDCGQMSAWYIFSAMGFYPVNPANGVYAIGSPALPEAIIHLTGGKTFRVTAENVSVKNIYIQSAKLNGRPYNKTYITQNDIANGGTLEFVMGDTPDKQWGTGSQEVPPLWGYQDPVKK
jgi:predicted alpha-1,2-mannosidase